MSYKRNTASNRDALFGPSGGGGGGGGGGGNSNPKKSSISKQKAKSSSGAAASLATPSSAATPPGSSSGASYKSRSKKGLSTFSGSAKATKMKEAEEYREKAKKAMTRGIFSRPDPVIAGSYYKKAAEIYKQCGENRLERLHRIASGDCQRGQECFPSAAMEYSRAAELVLESEETAARKRSEAYNLYKSAAEAWISAGEKGKAGQCLYGAAFGLLAEVEGGKFMARNVMSQFEECVEHHVPDPFNRYTQFRQTGESVYGPKDEYSKTMQMVKEGVVNTAYAHETLLDCVKKFVEFKEYSSALYASGAVSFLLQEQEATISLHRAYLSETILQLALKDVVAADKYFMEVHLQNNSYLSSRECKLGEDLIRAIKDMDEDALDDARAGNRAAMANLDPTMRGLVLSLGLSGGVKKKAPLKVAAKNPIVKTETPPQTETDSTLLTKEEKPVEGEGLNKPPTDNYAEMDQLMEDMGLDDDDDDDWDDDDIDLR